MSKRLSVIGTTALVAGALLGSAALLPALQKPAPAQSMELAMPLSTMQSAGSMAITGAEEASAAGDPLDYSFVFTSAGDDGASEWEPPKFRTTVPHSWGVNDDVVFD
jgi:hypothetical protein